MASDVKRIATIIAAEIGARPEQAAAAIGLLDEGATVPFVARYRKEVTGGLDDTQLRDLAERLAYLRELDARRDTILGSIREQGKLTEELEAKIAAAATKAELEDIYLPYKPKRRTKAEIARERGLGPLAEAILADRTAVPAELAAGLCHATRWPTPRRRSKARATSCPNSSPKTPIWSASCATYMKERAFMRAGSSTASRRPARSSPTISTMSSAGPTVPSHRALAMLRGRNEEVLSLDIEVDADDTSPVKPVERMIADAYAHRPTAAGRPLADGGRRLDLAREAVAAPVARPDARSARAGRGGGDPCLRPQSEGSAAGRAGRFARHDGARSRHPHRRQGGGGRRHRQAAGDDDGLSVPAEERCARHAGRAGRR